MDLHIYIKYIIYAYEQYYYIGIKSIQKYWIPIHSLESYVYFTNLILQKERKVPDMLKMHGICINLIKFSVVRDNNAKYVD